MQLTRAGWQMDIRAFVNHRQSQPGRQRGPARPPHAMTQVQLQRILKAAARKGADWTGPRAQDSCHEHSSGVAGGVRDCVEYLKNADGSCLLRGVL